MSHLRRDWNTIGWSRSPAVEMFHSQVARTSSAPPGAASALADGPQAELEDRIDAMVEPEEVLVTDPRAGLTPVQVVDLKLLTLMQTGNPGLFIQAAYTPQDIRRIPGKQLVPAPWCRMPAASLE